MVDLILQVILCGFATYFVLELISLVGELLTTKSVIYAVLSTPISYGFLYTFIEPNKEFFALVPATAFIATILNKVLNKPTKIQYQRIPRI